MSVVLPYCQFLSKCCSVLYTAIAMIESACFFSNMQFSSCVIETTYNIFAVGEWLGSHTKMYKLWWEWPGFHNFKSEKNTFLKESVNLNLINLLVKVAQRKHVEWPIDSYSNIKGDGEGICNSDISRYVCHARHWIKKTFSVGVRLEIKKSMSSIRSILVNIERFWTVVTISLVYASTMH